MRSKRSRTSTLNLPLSPRTYTYLPPQPCKRGSGCPDHNDAAIMVHGETPPEKVAAPPVARRKLGGLLPSAIRLPPPPPPGAIETPHLGLPSAANDAAAVTVLAADRRGRRRSYWRGRGRGRGGRVCVFGAAGGRSDEAGEQVDGSGARGVVLSGDVVGLRSGRAGSGGVGGPGKGCRFN